ncbi:MAG TPA: MerR family transcriptional regulator [Chloroflexota bacterium]|nr:MerR family transcriptional regulator [Chloroflexota bacterium]
MDQFYKVGEFAELTGVSIRTLHHYDRLGLLRPAARSEAGYRFYAAADLLHLQQILTLRYLGFSLPSIGEILSRPNFDLEASMRIQGDVIRARISAFEHAGQALSALLTHHQATGEWDWELVTRASAAARNGLAQQEDKMSEYYSRDELAQRMKEVGKDIPAEEIQAVEQAWPPLVAEVRANRELDPRSPEARDLADRWNTLAERTMRGFRSDPKIGKSIAENYRQNAYVENEDAPKPEDFAFIQKVNAARGT